MATSIDPNDRQLAAAAIEKRRRGETPTQREQHALRRVEKARDQQTRDAAYASITKGEWKAWSGRHYRVLNDQAARYGLPIGGRTIDLPEVVKWLHDFLAVNAHLPGLGDDTADDADPELKAARLEYLRERTRISRIDADRKEGVLLPRQQVHQVFSAIASVLRQATETLTKRFGADVHEVMSDALATADQHIQEIVGVASDASEHETNQTGAPE